MPLFLDKGDLDKEFFDRLVFASPLSDYAARCECLGDCGAGGCYPLASCSTSQSCAQVYNAAQV
jgi:hypothetical protein